MTLPTMFFLVEPQEILRTLSKVEAADAVEAEKAMKITLT
jgi:hypothetical protein